MAFGYCTNLLSIEIPDNVTNIGYCAFIDCISLEYVKMPYNLTTIDKFTFANCASLSSIMASEHVLNMLSIETFKYETIT